MWCTRYQTWLHSQIALFLNLSSWHAIPCRCSLGRNTCIICFIFALMPFTPFFRSSSSSKSLRERTKNFHIVVGNMKIHYLYVHVYIPSTYKFTIHYLDIFYKKKYKNEKSTRRHRERIEREKKERKKGGRKRPIPRRYRTLYPSQSPREHLHTLWGGLFVRSHIPLPRARFPPISLRGTCI